MNGPATLAEAILAGDRRAASRLISRAEAGDAAIVPDLRQLYRAGGHARVIGVTGPPGAGKSTLVDHLVRAFRARGDRVAVLAVDPTSPVSGGAVLGDRERMGRHAEDPGVFIRSMATRGALGGLALAAGDALTVLDAMRFDIVLVETVGVGQNEIDILHHADFILLLQTALSGDVLQTLKGGILEIADAILVNKASTPGSDKMAKILAQTLAERNHTAQSWMVPVLLTEAIDGTGIADVIAATDRFAAHQARHTGARDARERRRIHARVLAIANAAAARVAARLEQPSMAEDEIAEVAKRLSDPHALAARWTSMFFSEEKNQKTSVSLAVPRYGIWPATSKRRGT